jgi:hypothetical protein
VVGFEFYLSGCTSYRCLQQVILVVLQLVIEINILRSEDRDRVSSVGRIHPCLGIPNMSLLQHQSDSTSQVLDVHPIELRLTQSTKQVVDLLVVGVKPVPRSWSEEVHRLDIACVHHDIPKD